ncbi:hypothetical protein [Kineosporia succinea]|uniref:PPE family protein n=1 Tax=Kineosporia succinea TaxID=84632 RepID=A0ABT9P5F6_9ACTN|nr:hypothetical protein [Kineosporia succinea]MDP9827776.1 hypothetical protein [Kineosporia succinea]
MAPYEPGTSIEQVVFNVLMHALGAPGGVGSIDPAVTPGEVGKPGAPPWLVLVAQGDKPSAGWTAERTDGKLTFWRRLDSTKNEYVEIQLAGSPNINTYDANTPGVGNLVLTRDAWQQFYQAVPGYMGDGKVLDPSSLHRTRLWYAAVAEYYGQKLDEMLSMLDNLDQDSTSFRGSASETFVSRIHTAMGKVEGAREKAQAWDSAFDGAYQAARNFQEQVLRELANLGARYEGALLNPINFVIKLLNSARLESTLAALAGQDLNADHNVTSDGVLGAGGGEEKTVASHTILMTIPELGAAAGPYDVFQAGSWTALDSAIRAKWATEVSSLFPDSLAAATRLVTEFERATAALEGRPIPGDGTETSQNNTPNADNNPNSPGAGGDNQFGDGENGDPDPATGGSQVGNTFTNLPPDTPTGNGPGGLGLGQDTRFFGGGGDANTFGTQDVVNGAGEFGGGGDASAFRTDPNAFGSGSAGGFGDGGFGADGGAAGGAGAGQLNPGFVMGAGTLVGSGGGDGGFGGSSFGSAGLGLSLGTMSQGQLSRVKTSGQLEQFLVTDEMRDVLRDAGMAADGAVTLDELTLEQLTELQEQGLLDDLVVSSEQNNDDNWILGPAGLGGLTATQLIQRRDDGGLDGIPLTDDMRDALASAGLDAPDASTLGDLSDDQLRELQGDGLLDGVGADSGPGRSDDDGAMLFSSSSLDSGSSLRMLSGPQDLGDLTGGQLGDLQDAGLLDDVPVTSEQLSTLQEDGLLGSDGSALESLGDLTPGQLEDLQRAGLLDDVDLSPGQLSELGLSNDPVAQGRTGGSSSGGFGLDLPSSQFPTALDGLGVGQGGGDFGMPSGSDAPLGNISKSLATDLGSGTGFSVKAFEPGGKLAGVENIGTLSVPSSVAGASAGAAVGSIGGAGAPGMMPMMPGAGGVPGSFTASSRSRDQGRNRNVNMQGVDDVWGSDPDVGPAVVGRFYNDLQAPLEVPDLENPETDTDFMNTPGRARRSARTDDQR